MTVVIRDLEWKWLVWTSTSSQNFIYCECIREPPATSALNGNEMFMGATAQNTSKLDGPVAQIASPPLPEKEGKSRELSL